MMSVSLEKDTLLDTLLGGKVSFSLDGKQQVITHYYLFLPDFTYFFSEILLRE